MDNAYFATHGFAFISKGFDDLGCRRILVVNLRGVSERVILTIRGDTFLFGGEYGKKRVDKDVARIAARDGRRPYYGGAQCRSLLTLRSRVTTCTSLLNATSAHASGRIGFTTISAVG